MGELPLIAKGGIRDKGSRKLFRTLSLAFVDDHLVRRIAAPKENRMQRRMSFWTGVGVLAAVVVLAGIAPASAQTQGMERRGERRNDRAGARAAKQACKAGDEKSRAECRQVEREAKRAGRNDVGRNVNAAHVPNTAQ